MAHGKSPKHSPKKKAAAKPAATPRPRAAATPRPNSSKRIRAADRPIDGSIRLQKLLAAAGFGSRRQTESFIVSRRVTVNGRIATLGDSANLSIDDVRIDGERLARERPSYWILNKPRGVVTTVRDEAGRKTVMDLLPRQIERVYPVGRLDKETSGLLLLTNDGDTAHALLHPSLGNEREYRVSVKGYIDEKAVARLEKGLMLDDGRTSPGVVSQLRKDKDQETTTFNLILGEGRKRQIRRSLLILGFPVRRLVRVRMGPVRLGRLPVGEARPLRAEERRALLDHVAALRGEEAPKRPKRSSRPSRPRRSSEDSGTRSSAQSSTKAAPSAPKGPKGPKGARSAKPQRTARSRNGTRR